jgi:DNA-binding MarR family transcriptional regulator
MQSPSALSRIRRFNRAVTTEVGALDASYLGRGRALGVARVLCSLSPEGTEVSALRAHLGLDSGLASRILRTLEEEGLATTAPHPTDRRRRIARPTERGLAEIAAYDRLSDARAGAMLATLPRQHDDLLAAMDRIAVVLNRRRIAIALTDPATPVAQGCLAAYFAELDARFEGGFDPGDAATADHAAMRPPRGAFLVATSDGLPVACVALRGDGSDLGEVKRLWIAPVARGLGLARRMMAAVEDQARSLGMTHLHLDTNRVLTEAMALYRATGWTPVGRYNDNPYAHHWFAKALIPA